MIALRIALRELLNSKKYSIALLFSFVIGLSGFGVLEYFKSSFQGQIQINAKTLLGADISISSRYPISQKDLEKLDEILIHKEDQSYSPRMFSMALFNDYSQLVSVNTIGSGYPFYGNYGIEGKPIDELQKDEVLVYPEFNNFFDTKIGDLVKIGDGDFKIVGLIKDDTRQSLPMADAAPKVFMNLSGVKHAKLIQFGSTIRHTYYFKLKEEISDNELEKLKASLDPSIRIKTPKEASEQSGRIFGYLGDFLGLVSIVAILLSCIGLFYLLDSFFKSRKEDIKTYINIGMNKRNILFIYYFQILILTLIGAGITIVLSLILGPVLQDLLKDFLSKEVILGIRYIFILKLIIVALLVNSGLFLPVITRYLAQGFEENTKKTIRPIVYAPFLLVMVSLTFWLSRSWLMSTMFLATILIFGSLGVILISYVLKWIGRKKISSFSFRQIARYIAFNRFSTTILFLTLFFSCLFFSLVPQIQQNILDELSIKDRALPVLFMFDIQEEQVSKLKSLSQRENLEFRNISPMIRARITKINNEPYQLEYSKNFTREEQREFRFRNRGMNLSYRSELDSSEKIVEGKEFSGVYQDESFSKPAEISLEQRFAKRIGLKIGDLIEFDVLGMPVLGKVINLRKVQWTSFVPNFFILFQPGVLENAPKTFLGVVSNKNVSSVPEVQKLITTNFSNISSVDVVRVIDRIKRLIKSVAKVLNTMSILAIIVGVFVITIVIMNQINSRKNDIALYRMFGINLKDLKKIFLREFLVVSSVSSVLGIFACWIVSYVVSKQFFDGAFKLTLETPAIIIISVNLITFLIVSFQTSSSSKVSPSVLLEEN